MYLLTLECEDLFLILSWNAVHGVDNCFHRRMLADGSWVYRTFPSNLGFKL